MFSKIFSLFSVLLFAMTTLVYGQDSSSTSASQLDTPSLQKIYVQPSQIHITTAGIFFLQSDGELGIACGVFNDVNGVYVLIVRYQCPGCQRWNNNNICENKKCSLYLIK